MEHNTYKHIRLGFILAAFSTTMQGFLLRPIHVITRRMAVRQVVARSYATQQSDTESYETVDPVSDYPQLPWNSRQNLPAKGWDDILLRRNYGDPVRRALPRLFAY